MRRSSVRATGAAWAAVGATALLLVASPATAFAETDPDSGPSQTIPSDEPGTGIGGVWGPTSVNWVADQYQLDGVNFMGTNYYSRYDGGDPTWQDAGDLQGNLSYDNCYLQWWHPGQIACDD